MLPPRHQITAPHDLPDYCLRQAPACIVFALEEYSMLLYDGGPDDCDMYLYSHIRLFKPFPAEQAIGFVGYINCIVQYQQDFTVLAVLPQHCLGQQVLLAVCYCKLGGGISGYLATIVAKLCGVARYLHPDNTQAIPIEDPLPC